MKHRLRIRERVWFFLVFFLREMLSPTIKMKEQREPRVSGERKEAPNLSSLSIPTLWLVSNPPGGRPSHVTGVT